MCLSFFHAIRLSWRVIDVFDQVVTGFYMSLTYIVSDIVPTSMLSFKKYSRRVLRNGAAENTFRNVKIRCSYQRNKYSENLLWGVLLSRLRNSKKNEIRLAIGCFKTNVCSSKVCRQMMSCPALVSPFPRKYKNPNKNLAFDRTPSV